MDISTVVAGADKKYGVLDKNGLWSGQIGDLVKNRIDLSIMDLTILRERAQV
jgi:hypothetical protein